MVGTDPARVLLGHRGDGHDQDRPGGWLAHPGSVGRAIWGEVHIVGDDGDELPVGETGHGLLRGRIDTASSTTTTREDAPDSTTRAGAPFGTSGHVDEEGYLYLTDRKLFMIMSGGVNIYPQEIEDVLVMHPAVADVAVFGVPEPEMGEEVKAVVQPAPGFEPGPALEAEIIAFCRDHLSHYKCPARSTSSTCFPEARTGSSTRRASATPTGPAPAASTS